METVDYLVFSGGGAKGMAFCGTALMLDEMHRTGTFMPERIQGVIGCSIGSLFAMGFAMRLKTRSILEALLERSLLDDMEPIVDISNLCQDNALDTGERIKKMILMVMKMALANLKTSINAKGLRFQRPTAKSGTV